MTLPAVADLEAIVKAAFRTEWGAVQKCTTGPLIDVRVTSDGQYIRTTGSYLTDGFDPGDEVTAAGAGKSGNNGVRLVQSVSVDGLTLKMSSSSGMSTEAAGAAITLAMGVPSRQKLDGLVGTPDAGMPWVSESTQVDSVRAASIGMTAAGTPLQRMTGIYWLTVHYPLGVGDSGLTRLRGKIISRIYAGRTVVYSGHSIRVRTASPKTLIEKGNWLSGALAFVFQADAL